MKYIRIVFALVFIINAFLLNAGVEPVLTAKRQGSMIGVDSTVVVTDDKYSCITASNCSPKFKTPVLQNAVVLGIDHDATDCYQELTFTVILKLTKTPLSNPGTTETDTVSLTLTWNPDAGITTKDKHIYRTEGYIRIESKILSYTSSLAGNAIPNNIYIENIINKERYYGLNYTGTSISINAVTDNQDDELTVNWTSVSGAEEYDLEWLYLDDFGDYDGSSISYKSAASIPVDFRNNATRVTVKGTSYTLKNLYQHGYLLFRVRFVGRDTISYSQRLESRWSSHAFGATVSTFGTGNADRYQITANHEDTLNWQWTSSFAEDGKSKTVISYFDGSLRSRQMVTYTNTDQLTIVAESFYDHVGRKVVDALPVPTGDSVIKFYRNFNLSAYSHKTYSWEDFDTSETIQACTNRLTGMDTSSGASRYYSHKNPDKNLYQAYVPDAKMYPFVQVEFMPDNTGRVRRQSGVGYDHRMGSGHETQYFYGKPTQQELDMLFGVEVGDYNRYKKNMVVDPNGSISVSYLNPAGKVIATALAGENPSNLSVLPADTARKRIVEEFLPVFYVDSVEMKISMLHSLLLSSAAQVDFSYKIDPNQLETGCTSICYDCIYDLTFKVIDICGNLLHDTSFIAIKPFDTLCDNDTFSHSFSLSLDKGVYEVHKELSINKEAIEYYEDIYLANNSCGRTLQQFYDSLEDEIDYSECESGCGKCLEQLGSLSAYKTRRFEDLDTNGLNIDSLETQFEKEYNYYADKCNEMCDTLSACQSDLVRLLQDVSPGGQYANYSYTDTLGFLVTDNLSFLDSTSNNDFPLYEAMQRDWRNDSLVYYNNAGDTDYVWYDSAWVKPNDLPDSIFVEEWKPEWAYTLVKLHPEYCYYQWCIANEASNRFDTKMLMAVTWTQAQTDSLFDPRHLQTSQFPTALEDPFFKTGGLGDDFQTEIEDRINNYIVKDGNTYTMWEAAAIAASCSYHDNASTINTCLSSHPFGTGSNSTLISQWQFFRSFYLSEKQRWKDSTRAIYANTNQCSNCYIGHNNQLLYSTSCSTIFTADSFVHKQKQYPGVWELSYVNLDSAQNPAYQEEVINNIAVNVGTGIENACAEQCESYANQWMITLRNCEGFSADSAALRDSLINICKLGCDQFNPYGSRNVSPENESLVTRKSFGEIISHFFTVNKLCNEELITFPGAYNHNYYGESYVPIDDCFEGIVTGYLASACTQSDEINTLGSLLDDFAGSSQLKTTAEVNINTTASWNDYKTYLMSYTGGNQDSLNRYYTYTSGGNLNAVIKSRVNGVWDSCIITFITPEGHTTGLYDTIDAVNLVISSPNYSHNPPYTEFDAYMYVGSTEYIVKSYSTCYPVCSETDTVFGWLTDSLNARYCKNFTEPEVRDYLKAIYGTPPVPAYVPRDMSCKPECVTCEKLFTAHTAFWNEYDDVYTDSDTVELDTNFIEVYSGYVNRFLGFNKDYFAYKDFKTLCDSFYNDSFYYLNNLYAARNGCSSLSTGKQDTLLNMLSLCDEPLAYNPDTISCDSSLRQQAYELAQNLYEQQMDTLRGSFRRQYIRKCMNITGLESFTMAYDLKQYHYTLYYYDQADNLIKTVPPAGVQLITHADTLALVKSNRANKVAANYYNTPHHTLVTHYKYNTLNAVFEQTTPDGGTTEFYYDRLGRLAISQNAKQAVASDIATYSYTLYDELGRIAEVGETKNATAISDTTTRTPSLLTSWFSSAAMFTQVTQTYYDNKAGGNVDVQFTGGQQNLRNRLAYVTYNHDGTGDYDYATYYNYDLHGNVKELVHDYAQLQAMAYGYFKLRYEYDLISGNVNRVFYQQNKQDQFFHEYVYDADNRIRQVYTSRDNILKDNDAQYYYYQHGPLARTEIGELKVQGIDYAYTIHGWLKGVNSATLDSSRDIGRDGWWDMGNLRRYIPRDEYGFTLGYYAGDYYDIGQKTTAQHFEISAGGGFSSASPSLYNGNIRHMVTAIGKFMEGGAPPMGYAYNYDHLNRIKSMDAFDSVNMSGNAWYTGAAAMSQYHNRFTYDANGNILSQVRRGAESVNLALDSLVYKYYPGTNRLGHVDDVVNAANYTDDIDDQDSLNYKYDPIGNLIYDDAEQIDTIEWNVYGKITRIVRAVGSTKPGLEFEYGPDGNRVLKRALYPNDTAGRSYTQYYVRDAGGNIMATYNIALPYFEPIDTSYNKIIGKLIDTMGIASFAQFIQTRFAYNSTFYNKLEGYIPDSTLLDSFSMTEILSCVGDQMYHQLFSCCNSCGGYTSEIILTILDGAYGEANSVIPYLMNCKPEILLHVVLNHHGSDFLNDIGHSSRLLLYGYFKNTAGYLHVNSTAGDTINFLLSDVPRSELVYYFTHTLYGGLSMGYDNYIDALVDVMEGIYSLYYLVDEIVYETDEATHCKIIECLGNCTGADNENTCSNWGTNYLVAANSNYGCYGYSEESLRDHIQSTPELLAFVHSRLQLCYGERFENKLVKTHSDRASYSTFYNCGTRITEFGYDKYVYDSLISKLVVGDPSLLVDALAICDDQKLLEAAGNYNIKALVNKINAHVPQGSTYITNTCAHFQLTIPKPPGMPCDDYLAQVVPMASLLTHIKNNYSYFADDISAYPTADLIELFSRYYNECDFKNCTWTAFEDGTVEMDTADLIAQTRAKYWPYLTRELYNCNNDTFTLHAAYTRPYVIADLFENWHYPLDSFMINVQAYWNSTVRNHIDVDTAKKAQFLTVNEWHLYGSSRLGILQGNTDTIQGVVRSYQHRVSNDTVSGNYFALDTLKYYKFGKDSSYYLHKGLRHYEGTNHLGNVLVVFTDKRIQVCTNDTIHYYRADIVNAYDYSPFGAPLAERTWSSDTADNYRFGFNGQEKDNEVSGVGNSYTAEFWQYDGRLGRRWNRDPVIKHHESPYTCFANNPIYFVDPNGADTVKAPTGEYINAGTGYTATKDGKYIYGEGLTPKVWDPNADRGNGTLGWYVDIQSANKEVSNVNTFTGVIQYSLTEEFSHIFFQNNILEKIKNDVGIKRTQAQLTELLKKDPRIGNEVFSYKTTIYGFKFGGEPSKAPMTLQAGTTIIGLFSPVYLVGSMVAFNKTWGVGLNATTWVVRHTDLNIEVSVNCAGAMSIKYYFEDILDLRPNGGSSDSQKWYDFTTKLGGWFYHDVLGGNDQMKVNGSWTVNIE